MIFVFFSPSSDIYEGLVRRIQKSRCSLYFKAPVTGAHEDDLRLEAGGTVRLVLSKTGVNKTPTSTSKAL